MQQVSQRKEEKVSADRIVIDLDPSDDEGQERPSRPSLFVVKELPIAPSHVLQPILGRFLKRLARVPTPSVNMPRVVFVHTVHDSHSNKLDLNKVYGSQFTQSAHLIGQFHLPAVTQVVLVQRMLAVLEVNQRIGSKVFLEKLCQVTQGDIRQALLQVQWVGLTTNRWIRKSTAVPSQLSQRDKSSQRLLTTAKANGAASRGKRKRDDTTATSASFSFLDILDPTPPTPDALRTSIEGRSSGVEEFAEEEIDMVEGEEALFAALRRDGTIDVAHGAARVLTQKYQSKDVVKALSSDSSKLMGYVTNNLHLYFSDSQIEEYAAATAAASKSEALVSGPLQHATQSFGGGGSVTGRGDFLLTEGAGESTTMQSCADVAFHTFVAAYRFSHKEVQGPKGLTPHYPPRHQPPVYPVTSGPCGDVVGFRTPLGSEPLDALPPPRLLREKFQPDSLTRSSSVWLQELGPFSSFIRTNRTSNANSFRAAQSYDPSRPLPRPSGIIVGSTGVTYAPGMVHGIGDLALLQYGKGTTRALVPASLKQTTSEQLRKVDRSADFIVSESLRSTALNVEAIEEFDDDEW